MKNFVVNLKTTIAYIATIYVTAYLLTIPVVNWIVGFAIALTIVQKITAKVGKKEVATN